MGSEKFFSRNKEQSVKQETKREQNNTMKSVVKKVCALAAEDIEKLHRASALLRQRMMNRDQIKKAKKENTKPIPYKDLKLSAKKKQNIKETNDTL